MLCQHAVRGSVNAVDTFGCTACCYAAALSPVRFPDDATCMYLLVGAGADVNAAGSDGATPLHIAAKHGLKDIVAYLLSLPQCDVNARQTGEFTADDVAFRDRMDDVGHAIAAEVARCSCRPLYKCFRV